MLFKLQGSLALFSSADFRMKTFDRKQMISSSSEHQWQPAARAKEVFQKDPVSQNRKRYAVGRCRSLGPETPISLRPDRFKLQIAARAPPEQYRQGLEESTSKPLRSNDHFSAFCGKASDQNFKACARSGKRTKPGWRTKGHRFYLEYRHAREGCFQSP